ncbi:gliding motility lipoprotein GldH [uncultured Sunxiuqinia sp.]|uniref:gliding motility lipoprotein GldH n=1 Tax=uncultured Sunxiuqinia sp. TaxID=1573825 RepID=UPI00261589B4|nr:gliding motility lipoprotein GldH [uncultured Sunxiuqinia sp.]
MKNILRGIAIILLIVACDANRVYEDYKFIGEEGWHKDSAARFQVPVDSSGSSHNVYINIRNKGNYPNSNIWLFLEIVSPQGKVLTDTVEYILAEKSGKWRGSGIGDLFDNQFLYRKNVHFDEPGEYRFAIRQGMRAQQLKGIHDIGLRVEKQN